MVCFHERIPKSWDLESQTQQTGQTVPTAIGAPTELNACQSQSCIALLFFPVAED